MTIETQKLVADPFVSDFKIDWYRSPLDRARLAQLMQRDDLRVHQLVGLRVVRAQPRDAPSGHLTSRVRRRSPTAAEVQPEALAVLAEHAGVEPAGHVAEAEARLESRQRAHRGGMVSARSRARGCRRSTTGTCSITSNTTCTRRCRSTIWRSCARRSSTICRARRTGWWRRGGSCSNCAGSR